MASREYFERVKREREERAARYMGMVEVGSIFYSTWGYEQTNVDFYQVVKKTAKTIVLRAIRQESTPTGWAQEDVTPMRDAFDERPVLVPPEGKRCRMLGYSDRPMVSINEYANAWLWDGEPKHATSWA